MALVALELAFNVGFTSTSSAGQTRHELFDCVLEGIEGTEVSKRLKHNTGYVQRVGRVCGGCISPDPVAVSLK